MLTECNNGVGVLTFQRDFNVKYVIWIAAKAWDRVDEDTSKHGWHNLWTASLFFYEDDEEEPDFYWM
jgi:hypothetical protein